MGIIKLEFKVKHVICFKDFKAHTTGIKVVLWWLIFKESNRGYCHIQAALSRYYNRYAVQLPIE